jgi:UDP-galactopyranose mutase
MDLENIRYLVVGSGFFGCTIAERIANDLNEHAVVVERRNHPGGNSFSEVDSETGIEFHKYGSHIFHTNNSRVWEYITKFTTFNNYKHRVWTTYSGRVYSMPINLATINQFYSKALSPSEARDFIASEIARDKILEPSNLEEQAISLIGRPLYDAFIRGYTQKQWETDPKKLPTGIITRLPVRFDYNDRYFSDTFEGIPTDGYSTVFKRMLSHPKIKLLLNTDFFQIRDKLSPECLIIYTGPIDRYFNFKHGELSWRTIDLEKEAVNTNDFQGTSVMNFADTSIPFTRIHEFKHFHPEREQSKTKTLIFREYSRFARKNDEPYYPINLETDKQKYQLYRAEADKIENVIFGGRLGSYKYFDMHQAIGAALLTYNRDIKPRATGIPYKSPVEEFNQ